MVSWITKNILNKFYIHPLSYILLLLLILTGSFKETLIVFFIIIIHELGHLLSSKIFKWKLDKIVIYPFGGCVKFNEDINRPILEEIIIIISGPLFQIILFFIITIIYNEYHISPKDYLIFKNYHYTLLTFNLLPIYPLDGGKLFNAINNYFFPYKKGNIISTIISIIILVIISITYNKFNFLTMSLIILFEQIQYIKRQGYLYNKFLLERYIKKYNFKKIKVIKNKNNMYRNKKHVILNGKKYITEREYLIKRFGKKI